jgi:hypothetical protein
MKMILAFALLLVAAVAYAILTAQDNNGGRDDE